MAVTLPGTGTVVDADIIAGKQIQYMKPMLGAPGVNDGPVSADNPMPTTASNVTAKFREAFENYVPNGPKWNETKGTGDLVFIDGNALAASYLVVSKSPLDAGTETFVETVADFGMPVEVAFGLSMSQATLGQEASVEIVDTDAVLPDVPDIAIASITQATTTLTVTTVEDHGLVPGKAIGIKDCSNQVANYPALVVASIPSPRSFTATAGPGGTIPSQTIANPAGAKGSVFFRERLGRSNDGTSLIFENTSVTQASAYVRSDSGDALPSGTAVGSHVITVGSRASVQLATVARTYALAPTTEFRCLLQADRIQWADAPVDTMAALTNRIVRSQVTPSALKRYKFRLRFNNSKSLTVPVAQIVTAVKTGTTTATVTTDRPHGLVTGDFVVIYGARDQSTTFGNLVTAVAITFVSATQFTIVWGIAGTATTFGGYVTKVQGGNLMSALGALTVVAQTATLTTLTNGERQLTVVANGNLPATVIPGDVVELVGVRNAVDGAPLDVDGPWKVTENNSGTVRLALPVARTIPADFGTINCGGGIIKRTDVRLSFVRVFDFERLRVEATPRPAGDLASAMPVAVQGTVTTTLSSTAVAGTVANDGVAGNPVTTGGVARNTTPTAVNAAGDAVNDIATMNGAKIVKPYAIPESEWTAPPAVFTTTADAVLIASAGAGLKRHLTWLHMKNTGASAIDVTIKDGGNARLTFTLDAAGTPGAVEFLVLPTGITTTAATALNVALSAVGTVRINAGGYIAP